MSGNFWKKLEKPIIGVSPMDGITDAAFRYMICKYSDPALVMTEFTNVEGLARGAAVMLKSFLVDDIERNAADGRHRLVIAQIYGVEPESFFKCAVMLCELGFDGIDINMGCPANNVARQGSGAGLIQTPELAKMLVRETKRAVNEWATGLSMEEAGVHPNVIAKVMEMKSGRKVERRVIPISVKTRTGFDREIAEEWVRHLLEAEPDAITMHGRTLKQMYMGLADWEAIGRAGRIVREAGVTFLGNGDVSSMENARKKCAEFGVDGVLVGRALFGDPWFFDGGEPSLENRLAVVREHAQIFEKMGYAPFFNIRKHLAWYCKGFEGAKELRVALMKTNNAADVEDIVQNCKNWPL